MRNTLVFAALLFLHLSLSSFSAWADPRQGEFAGHQLGAALPKGRADAEDLLPDGLLRARAQVTPDLQDFEHVELIATPKSRTIVSIWAVRNFRSPSDAAAEFESQAALLNSLYHSACPPLEWEDGVRASFVCAAPTYYAMTVEVVAEQDGTATLRFGLRLDRLSENLASIQKLIDAETGKAKE